MGKIIIQKETTKDPVSLIGREAGVCWGADITKEDRNYKRGLDCLSSGHGRTWEYPQVYMILEGYPYRRQPDKTAGFYQIYQLSEGLSVCDTAYYCG